MFESNSTSNFDEGFTELVPFENVNRILAPNAIVNQFTGPFNNYKTFAEVPRAMRAVPDANSYAAGALDLWWSDPEQDAGKGRVLGVSRRKMVWMMMHIAERLEILPSELWLLIITFVENTR